MNHLENSQSHEQPKGPHFPDIRKIRVTLAAVALTACSDEYVNPISCITPPEDDAVQPYHDLLTDNPEIVEAMGLCEKPVAVQKEMWKKIIEAERYTKLAPSAPPPAAYYSVKENQKTIDVLPDEAHEILGAHYAHSLWLEKNGRVPWSISEYTSVQLRELYKTENWFSKWDDVVGQYSMSRIVNHSPFFTYEIAKGLVPELTNQKAALNDLIKSFRDWDHSSAKGLDEKGNPIGGTPEEIITVTEMALEKLARDGCHSMSLFMVHMATALNIPGSRITGYYFGDAHSSAAFAATDQVLAHGDDVYSLNLANTPSAEIMDSYTFWSENVLNREPGDPGAAHNSMLHSYKNALKYPSYRLMINYCSDSNHLNEVFLEVPFGPFATAQELATLEEQILQLTENCTTFPANNPD